MEKQVYLGDGLYAQATGYYIRVYTARDGDLHYLYFDPDTLELLNKFATQHYGPDSEAEAIGEVPLPNSD